MPQQIHVSASNEFKLFIRAECKRQLLSLSKNNWKKFSGSAKSLMLAPDYWSVTTDLPAGCCISFV